MPMPDKDYKLLDRYIRTVLTKLASGDLSLTEATEDIMHPLSGWDRGNTQEFIPWIKLRLAELEA